MNNGQPESEKERAASNMVARMTDDALNFINRVHGKPDDAFAERLHSLAKEFQSVYFVPNLIGKELKCSHYRGRVPLQDIYPLGMLTSSESVIVITDEGGDRRILNTACVPVHNLMRFCPFCGAARETWYDPNI